MPAHSRFLRYFLAVARLGSIRRAAEELRIAASAIDRQLLLAERELGASLFERLPTGLRLTAAGELFLRKGRQWSAELDTLRGEIDDLHGLRRGAVTIALIDALSLGLIPRLIRGFSIAYPHIELHLRVLDNKNIPGAVATGMVDFGLMLDPAPSRDIRARPVAHFDLGFILPSCHVLAKHSDIRASVGVEWPLILPAPPLALCTQVERIEALAGVTFRPIATADNIQMIKSLVLEGFGIGLLSSIDVHEEVRRGDMAFIKIKGNGQSSLTLAFCTAPHRQLSSAANKLMIHLDSLISKSI